MGIPPLSTGGFHEIAIAPSKGVTTTPTGALGADLGVRVTELEATDCPASFTATTVTVWAIPLVNPEIVQVVFATPPVEPST